jgi:class 3 adenylate cyclase
MRKRIATYSFFEEEQKVFMLLLFLLIPLSLFSQEGKNVGIDEKKADSLYAAGNEEMKKGNFANALTSLEESVRIFTKIQNDKSLAQSYNQIATIYFYQSDFDNALQYFEKSRTSYQKADYKKGVASTTNNMGAVYYYQGNYPRAIEYYKKALHVHEELQNKIQIAGTTQNIGNIYIELQDYKSAKKHFDLAKKAYEETNNQNKLALVLSSLGKIYVNEEEYDKALDYFTTSLELVDKENDKQTHAEIVYNLAKLYEVLGDDNKAFELLNQSLEIARESKSDLRESSALIALGIISEKLGRKRDAITLCKKGLAIATKINSVSIQEEGSKCLYNAYKSANNPFKALQYNEQMYALRDSLNLKQTSDKILNMKFEREMLLDSIETARRERQAKIEHERIVAKKEKQRNIFITVGCFVFLIAVGIFSRLRLVKKSKARLQVEKDRSEHLLLNILPEEIAEELKEKGFVDAQHFEIASILFTDFKSFTATASQLSARELVEEINVCFKAFDAIMGKYNIEKIKTIGDAYMAAGGLPKPDADAVKNTILAALEMQAFMQRRYRENELRNQPAFEMRVGIHVGPIVAGIVGVKKFQYDVWGDTVNTASRMESNGVVGKVNVSHSTYELVQDEQDLLFEYRGKVQAKGKGELKMYFVSLRSKEDEKEVQENPILTESLV